MLLYSSAYNRHCVLEVHVDVCKCSGSRNVRGACSDHGQNHRYRERSALDYFME